ncbi:unnamed protein product [Mucor fragilis]
MSVGNSFQWSWIQYPFFAALVIFDMVRFTLPAMVVFTWLITFYAVQFIPNTIKPQHIFVNILPTLERIIYGANLSEIISQHTSPALDIFAWLPYGIIHFAFPFAFSLALFIFGPPGTLAVFGQAFGYMNLAGVLTQLVFPTSPPWYELSYGSAPADYSVHGQPGGLARIDEILGLNLYGTTFGNSPLVFGAFPSLHSGCATIEMLFLAWLCPKARPYCVFHVMWMWFATMYLTHHYLIDLVGGSIYATLAFFFFRRYLPVIRPGCLTRLDYIDSKVPVKNSFANFVRSIEMERFMDTLNMAQQDDTEAMLLKNVQHRAEDDSFVLTDDDDEEEEEQEDSTNSYDHVPLRAVRKEHMYIITNAASGPSSLPSTSTSPTCSDPPSPVTPHSDVFFQQDIKQH